jgi:hypothetical protein
MLTRASISLRRTKSDLLREMIGDLEASLVSRLIEGELSMARLFDKIPTSAKELKEMIKEEPMFHNPNNEELFEVQTVSKKSGDIYTIRRWEWGEGFIVEDTFDSIEGAYDELIRLVTEA